MRLIYEIANALLGRGLDRPLLPEGSDTSHAALATLFQRSFTDKVDALCHNRSQQPAEDTTTEVTARLYFFEPALPWDVIQIVLASAVKSCEQDPFPTSLLKCHIDFLSPVLARITNASLSSSQQLQHFMDENGIYGVYQSVYRPHHSAETALLCVHNDVAQAKDSRRGVLLVLLDFTAALDTIDHTILLRRLRGYGLCGDVHAWLTSYLHNRTKVVRVKSSLSEVNNITK